MEHVAKTAFARAEKVCADGPDKWKILNAVTEAAQEFGLSHRTIGVLRALLSFLPTRHIPVGPRAIVFPANATLSDRLHGMPESTLRRHIAALVGCGIVSRHDSPNRKRYARRGQGGIVHAFGLDLSPLAQHARQIQDAANRETERKTALKIKRDIILSLRHTLQSSAGENFALLQDAHRVLRRTPDNNAYSQLIRRLETAIDALSGTPEMSGTDTENERHIEPQSKPKYISAPNDTPVTLGLVLSVCSEIAAYFPTQIQDWRSFVTTADQVAGFLGISSQTLNNGKTILGPEQMAIVIACILQKAATVDNPSGYVCDILRRAGRDSNAGLAIFHALGRNPGKLSADNPESDDKTIG